MRNKIIKMICIVILLVICIILDKFVFLKATEVIWVIFGFCSYGIWELEEDK